jgi:hypothetical protein
MSAHARSPARPAARRPGERGSTIIEVMAAAAITLVCIAGFFGMVRYGITANGVAHRRTVTTLLRSALIDRLAVTTHATFATLSANTWYLDSCYDQNSQLVGSNTGNFAYGSYTTGYTCPSGTFYRAWFQVSPNSATQPTNITVNTYVERVDNGCAASARYTSVGCSAADLLLTD